MGMSNLPLAWGDDSPEPLLYSCARNVVCNPEIICERYVDSESWALKQGLTLPQEICEVMISIWQDLDPGLLTDDFLSIFEDLSVTRLKRVTLRNSSVTDEGLKKLLLHKLIELDVTNCAKLSTKSYNYLNQYGKSLISLFLCESIFKVESSSEKTDNYVLNMPNLQKLVLNDICLTKDNDFFTTLLSPLKNLCHLDLSGCLYIGDITYMTQLKCLRSLILFGVIDIEPSIPVICQIRSLRVLDISQEKIENGTFLEPNSVLEEIARNLSQLVKLDISCTNLAGSGSFAAKKLNVDLPNAELDSEVLCDIPELQCRVKHPLEFLGLYNTFNDACKRYSIPAQVITGDASEAQVLAATEAYLSRPSILVKALNDLYHIFRYETCSNHQKALNLILLAMMKHKDIRHIQISGSASLFYIAKDDDKSKLNFFAKRKIINVLLDAMDLYIKDSTMMRNSCLTICQFRIPQDIDSVCSYKRLVELLLRFVRQRLENEDFVRKVAMYLLNSLACQVDGFQKELVGDLGAIETMLKIIEDRLARRYHDDILEIAWSAMWNVTDETPINCQRFLDEHGMKYFQRCLSEFPDKEELLRNMMGLLGNVAEVTYLRPRLLKSDLIETFAKLLDSTSDGIEVSYNAAGVLSHIASDGPEAWTIDDPPRQNVLRRMVQAVTRWDLHSRRNINYRSFEPILRLVRVDHTPECQLWAVWALANLTAVQPAKYCSLVEEEGGLDLLRQLTLTTHNEDILNYIEKVMSHCDKFKETREFVHSSD